MKHSKPARVLAVLLACVLLCACEKQEASVEGVTSSVFAMDTIMDLTPYGAAAEEANTAAEARILELESLFSVTQEGSDVYRANHGDGVPVTVSEDTAALLETALRVCAQTDGALDISIYPVLRTWGFTTGSYQVPDEAEIQSLLERVNYRDIAFDADARTVSLPDGMEIDLGSVAKGYTGDQVMQVFRDTGVTSGMINLGGNVQVLGTKPDGSAWRVAVQDPRGDGYVGVIEAVDQAVITSGGYQRYFEQDGEIYWHILDPATGAPAHSGVISATAVGDSGTMCDALSTALFVMGADRAEDYWRTYGGFDYLLVTEDGKIILTEGLADRFEPLGTWESSSVTVVKK